MQFVVLAKIGKFFFLYMGDYFGIRCRRGFPGSSVVKNPLVTQEMQKCGFDPWVERYSEEENGNPPL